jgi:hypothetical protein
VGQDAHRARLSASSVPVVPSVVEISTAVVALYGAGLATANYLGARRRRLIVTGDFVARRVGNIDRHEVFAVRLTNIGQRAITITEIWWDAPSSSSHLKVWLTSTGSLPPLKVEIDEYAEIIYDPDVAATQIASMEVRKIRVLAAAGQGQWSVAVGSEQATYAAEVLQRAAEQDDEEP